MRALAIGSVGTETLSSDFGPCCAGRHQGKARRAGRRGGLRARQLFQPARPPLSHGRRAAPQLPRARICRDGGRQRPHARARRQARPQVPHPQGALSCARARPPAVSRMCRHVTTCRRLGRCKLRAGSDGPWSGVRACGSASFEPERLGDWRRIGCRIRLLCLCQHRGL